MSKSKSGKRSANNTFLVGKKQPLQLPHAWDPYPWQADVLKALQEGYKKFCLVVHRRAGKDQVALNMAAICSQWRKGQYWHILPYASQSKTNIWNGRDKSTGIRFIDQAFPEQMRTATREQVMELDLINGSQFKILGSDNFNAFRSGNPLFISFSEAAYANKAAWLALSPIIRENDGIVCFISTPDGQNWFHKTYENAKNNDEWYTCHLTVEDTVKHDGKTPIIPQSDIQAERDEGKEEDYIRREFYCDFNTGVIGAYYVKELHEMHQENRMGDFPWDEKKPVTCVFDLGYSDELVALFFQKNKGKHRMIASRAWQYTEMTDALDEIQVVFPWKVDKYLLPHDAASRVNRGLLLSAFEQYGETDIVEKGTVHAGIQATRKLFANLWIDNETREYGDNSVAIEAFGAYRSKQSNSGVASASPYHNWASHYADALRYYAVGEAQGLNEATTDWGPDPDYTTQDLIARTI